MTHELIELTKKNDIQKVKKFIADGGDINIQDGAGNTALIIASYHGYTEIVKALIEDGAKLDIQDKYGNTALTGAEKKGYVEIVKILKEPRNYDEIGKRLIKRLTKKFEEKEKRLTEILEEKEGKLLAGFQTKFNGLQYRNLNDLQSAKFLTDYEKRIICGLLPMPIAKINN